MMHTVRMYELVAYFCFLIFVIFRERERERQTVRQTEIDTQTDRHEMFMKLAADSYYWFDFLRVNIYMHKSYRIP